jgi:hypothetical protein
VETERAIPCRPSHRRPKGHWPSSSAITVFDADGRAPPPRNQIEDARSSRRRRAAEALPGDGAGGGEEGVLGGTPLDGRRLHPGAARAPPHG